MKMDRNINSDGRGKYALVLMRKLDDLGTAVYAEADDSLDVLEEFGVIDWGERGTHREFFVIRLKDKYAQAALMAYAEAAEKDDPEWAAEVREMARRSGPAHPDCKRPD